MKKKHVMTIIAFILTSLSVCAGLFLPEYKMERGAKARMNLVETVPKEYYFAADTPLAKELSSNLSAADTYKLTSGVWEHTFRAAALSEASLSEYSAVLMAKEKVELLYAAEIYPFSLISNSDNWYSWDASLFCCTDSTFRTYSTYIWDIRYEKYDGSIVHRVLMTDSGLLLNVSATPKSPSLINETPNLFRHLSNLNLYMDAIRSLINENSANLQKVSTVNSFSCSSIAYPELDLSEAALLDTATFLSSKEDMKPVSYTIYQYSEGNGKIGVGLTVLPEE